MEFKFKHIYWHRLRNKFLQLILISLDSASWGLHQYSRRMCGPMKNPQVETRSRDSSSGPHDCKADALPHDHGHPKSVSLLVFSSLGLCKGYTRTEFSRKKFGPILPEYSMNRNDSVDSELIRLWFGELPESETNMSRISSDSSRIVKNWPESILGIPNKVERQSE